MDFHELITKFGEASGFAQYVLIALVSYVAYASLKLRVNIRDEMIKAIETSRRETDLAIKEHRDVTRSRMDNQSANLERRMQEVRSDFTPSAVLTEQFTRTAEQFAHVNLLLTTVGCDVREMRHDVSGLETRLTRIETRMETMCEIINGK